MVTLFHHRPSCYPLPMEQASNGSGNGISDVEFLEFLVGYSNNNNGGGNNNSQNHHHNSSNGNQPQFSTTQNHLEASSTSPAHSNRENNEDLHQPWRSPHQQDFTDHIQQQQQQQQPKQPIHIQIPSPSSPSAAAAEEQEDPRRRSGMVERWEPGEVIEEAAKTPTPPSASATDPRAGSSSSFSSASSDASSPTPTFGGKPVS